VPCRLLTACLILVAAHGLAGCSTMRAVERASGDFSKLAESATKLADASSDTLERAKESMAAMDVHMGEVGRQMTVIVPKLAEDTRTLVATFEKTTREMGAATTAAINQTSGSIEEITPHLTKTLDAIATTTTTYGIAIKKIGTELGEAGDSLDTLGKNLEANATDGRKWILATQKQLEASMKAAERTLDQTADTLANLEKGLLETLQGTTKTLKGINRVLLLDAEDDDEMEAVQGFGHRLDTLVTTFLLVFLGGGVLLVVLTTLVVYDRITSRRRLRLQLAALGVDVTNL
jgi:hypothetical protein